MSWLISAVVLGGLVLVHELGHFLVARWSGVRVTRFSIGFGPVLCRWTRGDTEYVLSLLPLGGYVKMAGEHRTEATNAPGEFLSQSPGVRARIVLAGPLVNSLVSILTLWVVLVIGYPELLPTVGRVLEGMPAQAAGVQVGDRILAIEGEPVHTWDDLTRTVHDAPDHPLAFTLQRGDASVTVTITPQPKELRDAFGRLQRVGLVGVAPSGAFETRRVSPLAAVGETFAKQVEWTGQIGLSLVSLATGRVSMQESLTGPIGIMYMTSEAARMGFSSLVYLMSIFSLSLAIFNLFPVPILDGGHLLFLAAEKLRGRPVSVTVQEKAAQVSFALLMLLAVFVCVNDVHRLGLFDKLQDWWRAN